ncbi:hypothetical protein K0M31_010060, partial [Melipona bicolor]
RNLFRATMTVRKHENRGSDRVPASRDRLLAAFAERGQCLTGSEPLHVTAVHA